MKKKKKKNPTYFAISTHFSPEDQLVLQLNKWCEGNRSLVIMHSIIYNTTTTLSTSMKEEATQLNIEMQEIRRAFKGAEKRGKSSATVKRLRMASKSVDI